MTPRINVFPDPASVAAEAADMFVSLARNAIASDGRFTVALAGGNSPAAMYRQLATAPRRSAVDWSKVEVFFGDERCVPPDHQESNFRLAHEALLGAVPIPPGNVYRMRGEDPDPNNAARVYGLLLQEKFGDIGGLDLCILGMGEDGHTASLFPGTSALREQKHRCVAHFVEKSTTGPSWRLTLTAPFINRSRHVLVLITGEKKAARVAEVLEGPQDPQRLPIQLIQPQGQLTWLLDTAAASMQDME